jgi:hypothetical protein
MARAFNGTSHGLQSASALAALSGVSRIAVGFWLSTTYVADDDIALELSVNSNTNLGSFKVIAGDSTSTSLFAECVGNVGKNDGHCTPPSGSTWHHILINYDFSKATNETDTVYVDGVSQTLTRTTNSNNTGTFASYVLYVMSRAGTSLFADGSMADLCIWAPSSVLTSGDASSLAAGARANTVRTSEVAYYWRLDGTTSPEPNTVGGIDLTVTGATFVADPPALVGGNDGPQTVPMLLPSMGYGRDDAAGPESTVFPMRPWQRRFQWVGQPWLNSDDPVAAPASTDAPAEVAAGSGSAGDPAAAFGVNAEAASGSGSAPDPAEDFAVNAGSASGTGTAPDGTASAGVNAEAASGTGTAADATVATAGTANAPAEAATGTGAAPDPAVAVAANAEAASGTGTAGDPVPSLAVNAEAASGSGSALQADNPPVVVGSPTSTTGSATTTAALAWDAGLVAGDLLTMWVSQVGVQTISSTSLGLTQKQRITAVGNTAALTVLTKVLTAGDITAGTVTATFAASQRHAVTLIGVRNHAGDVDLVGTAAQSGTATSTVSVPALTPGGPNNLLLGAVGGQVGTVSTDVTWTFAGPLVKLSEVNSTGAVNRAFLTTAAATEVGPAASSGPDAPTPSTTVDYGAFRISILPAGTGAAANVSAEAATGVGAAADAAVDAQVGAEAAAGTGTSPDPVAAVGANAEAASGTGAALDATVATVGNTSAPAELASGTGTAGDASAAVTVNAEAASATGTAGDTPAAGGALPTAATGTGTALDAQAGGHGQRRGRDRAGSAFDATVSTAALANANAELASGTGTALDPAAAVAATGGAATGTGAGLDATVTTATVTNAPAEAATAVGVALDAATAVTVPAEAATGAGAAPDPVGQVNRDATPGAATAVGAALDAAIAAAVTAGLASGTGVAMDALGVSVLPFTVGVLAGATTAASGLTAGTAPTAVLAGTTSSGGPR